MILNEMILPSTWQLVSVELFFFSGAWIASSFHAHQTDLAAIPGRGGQVDGRVGWFWLLEGDVATSKKNNIEPKVMMEVW